ncbi:hypothetical protein G6F50_015952 [Rhizopus delemar]|uniref:Uncharacterized protein n=1 Tax=Rhizopus delemar TaxID=936053 RepID=A0A9P7C344_9FUNG|nr:hypothetical protein G6F50_015952 [Rhizopus delemar]
MEQPGSRLRVAVRGFRLGERGALVALARAAVAARVGIQCFGPASRHRHAAAVSMARHGREIRHSQHQRSAGLAQERGHAVVGVVHAPPGESRWVRRQPGAARPCGQGRPAGSNPARRRGSIRPGTPALHP